MKKWLLLISGIAILLVVGLLIYRPTPAVIDLLGSPPTTLRVTLLATYDKPVQPPRTFQATPAVQNLYFIMRTRAEGNYPGGCRVVAGLAGTKTEMVGIHYQVTFLRQAQTLLDVQVRPECNRFYLNNYNGNQGAFMADLAFIQAFRLATQLPYPPPIDVP